MKNAIKIIIASGLILCPLTAGAQGFSENVSKGFSSFKESLSTSFQKFNKKITEEKDPEYFQSFLTNSWRDNLYIGVGFGPITRWAGDITKAYINPEIEINVNKWFTPEFSMRGGVMFSSAREGLNSYTPYQINHSPFPYMVNGTDSYTDSSGQPGTLYYGSFMAYADFMWNFMSTFKGYQPNRFHTMSLYVSGAYIRLRDNKTEDATVRSQRNDREFGMGIGLYNTFRMTDRLVLTADLRLMNHASRYRSVYGIRTTVPSLSLGAAYNIFRTKWTSTKLVLDESDKAKREAKAAQEALEAQQQENEDLKSEVQKLNSDIRIISSAAGLDYQGSIYGKVITYEKIKEMAQQADLVVYFYINEATLNFSELYHLNVYVKECLEKDPNHVFYITGSADKGTGTEPINKRLSMDRALYIKNILIKDFGVNKNNIVVESVVTDRHVDGAYDRCGILESK